MIKFKVMSREEAFKYSLVKHEETSIIISITDIGSNPVNFAFNPSILDILALQFNDEDVLAPYRMTIDDAAKILNFVNSYPYVDYIIVQCEAGISRSAGVCAALMKIITGDDSQIFDDMKYCPNRYCYALLLNAYFGTYDEDEIEEKYKRNIEKWFEVHKEDL